jgi:hypothetical protein
MAKQLAKATKGRKRAPGEESKRALREARCLFNDASRKEGFVPLSKNTLRSSTWETSIASLKIRW